jgi:hypothetical protein
VRKIPFQVSHLFESTALTFETEMYLFGGCIEDEAFIR